MILVQNNSGASYGSADSLNADVDTIQQYVGRSSLTLFDTLDILFTRQTIWKPNRQKTDFTAMIRKQSEFNGGLTER